MDLSSDLEIEASGTSLQDLFAALKRRLTLLVVVFFGVFFVGVLIALILPSIYRSEATILIERQEIPTELVRSTVTSLADQRVQVLRQRVLSSSNLMEIIQRFDLYSIEREREPREVVLEEMKESIILETISADVVDPRSGRPTVATIAVSLGYENKNPTNAQRVVNELVSKFLSENIKSRTDSALGTTSFLNEEAELLRDRVSNLELKIAKFKDQNPLSRPELEVLTRDLMNRTELNLTDVDRRIHESVQQGIYLEADLARRPPSLVEYGSRGEGAIELLRAVESNLSAAEAAYSENHPDVIRLRKQAEAMRETTDPNTAREVYESELSAAYISLSQLRDRYDGSHPEVLHGQKKIENLKQKLDMLPSPELAYEEEPNNPAFVALKARVDANKAQLESLKITRAELVKKLDDYANNLMKMPDAEAQYRALMRDYETTAAKYRETTAKQSEAQMSQNLEADRKSEKFTLIEPPLLPEKPVSPNRPAIIMISFVLAILLSLGLVTLVESADDRIRGRSELIESFGAPPLVSIPKFEATEEIRATKGHFWLLGGVAALILVTLLTIHNVVMPLDVLWYTLARKTGI